VDVDPLVHGESVCGPKFRFSPAYQHQRQGQQPVPPSPAGRDATIDRVTT
jgi:hypothetical protein